MITITDGQTDVILDDIQEDEFWQDNHRKSLKDNIETFDFVTFANKGFSKYLAKRNRIIIPDEDGKYIEFIIHNTRKYRSPQGGLFIEVYTMASYTELATSKVIRPQKTPSWTPKQHVEFALAGTGYEVGQVDHGGFRTLTIEQYTNPFAYLKRVASEYDFELHFRIETNGNKVTRRYVDLIKRVGNWQGREVEFGKDLLGIERKEDTSKVVTALIGLGPEREDGTRLELIVEDKEALARWGRNGQHIIDIYEPESTDTEMTEERLRTLTENELKKRVNSVVEYTADIADLEKVSGLEHEKIRFGDVIRIKDIDFNPPLYLEARIHTMERSIKKNGYKTVTLGDYIEYTEEEITAIWKSLKAELAKKVSMSDVTAVVYTKPEVDSKDADVYRDSTHYADNVSETKKQEAIQAAAADATNKANTAEQNAKNHADTVAEQKKQEAIQQAVADAGTKINTVKTELEADIALKADAEWVNGQLQLKADSETVSVIQNTVDELQDTASSLQQAVDNHADQLEEQGGKITKLETDYDELEGSLNATITELSNLSETISRHETQIEANAREIALKASQQEFDSLSGTVSDISGQLTVMAGQIEAKAEKSELEELEGDVSQINTELSSLKVDVEGISTNVSNLSQTVTNHGTQISNINSSITQLSGEIESKVDKTEYETDKDGIISRLNSAETRISQTEDEIQARVTKTEYQQDKQQLEGNISSLESRMQKAETSITANAQAIQLKANASEVYTKSEVDSAISDIQVGGRNLILNSSRDFKVIRIGSWTGTIQEMKPLEELGLRPNDPVTLSFYARVPSDAPASVYPRITCYRPDGTYHIRTGGKMIGPGEEGFTTFTTILPSDCNRVEFHIQRTGGGSDAPIFDIEIKEEKAEKGNKPTDWTPAPEDVQSQIDDAIADIEVGGRNLLPNTLFVGSIGDGRPEGWTSNSHGTDYDKGELVVSPFDPSKLAMHIKVNNARYYIQQDYFVPVNAGEKITISVNATSKDLNIWWEFIEDTNRTTYIERNTNFKFSKVIGHRLYETFTVPEGAKYFYLFRIGIGVSAPSSGEVIFEGIKIEKGNKPTDWTPAPEAIQAEIDKKVDETVYENKVSELTTSINGISANVSNLQTTVGQHGTSISNLQSQVNIQADQIATKVDATFVNSAIDNIQVGERNLILNSSREFKRIHITSWMGTIQGTKTLDELGLRPGDPVTFSFYARVPEDAPGSVCPRITCYKSDGTYYPRTGGKGIGPGEEGFTTFTTILPSDCEKVKFDIQRSDASHDAPTFEIEIKEEKAVKGNKATDWTPAPEDIQAEIDDVYQYASSEIQQLAGEVRTKAEASTVTALGNRVSTAEQDISALQGQINQKVSITEFNALGQRVSTAEQDINALEGQIAQKVSQTTFNALENRVTQAESTITQTANNVTVAFNRIDSIDGVLNSAVTTIDASGVTVKDGSFYLEDDTSDTKYSIVPKTNLLGDHSFEMVERGSGDLTYGDYAVKPPIDSYGKWKPVGSPRLISSRGSDWAEFSLFYFGSQAIVVSSTDYVEQSFPYIPGKTYTVSAYFTGSTRSTSGVPRIDVRLEQDVTGEVKKTWTRSFPSVTFGQKLTRCALTFTVPADADNEVGGDVVIVSIRADSGWVEADGAQVVEGETPTLYDPENAVWDLLYGQYEGRGFTGDYTIVDYGSNENGNFVMFGQGLQICWVQTEINMAINNQYGVLYQNSMKWIYPATFVDIPTVCVGEARWSTGASWGTPTTTERLSTDIRVIDVSSRGAGPTRIKAIAIGRWK